MKNKILLFIKKAIKYFNRALEPPRKKITWEHMCEVKKLYLVLDINESCIFCGNKYSKKEMP